MERRKTRQVRVGKVKIGGGAPITVQSMLNTRTTDIEGSLRQIAELADAGCDLIRLAVPDEASAEAFGAIAERCGLPLIADIHYSYKLAHLALDAGAKKIRMNPGNMRDRRARACRREWRIARPEIRRYGGERSAERERARMRKRL